MRVTKKLTNNIFSRRALSVLGLALYVRYVLLFLKCLRHIISSRDLRPLDRAMGLERPRFKYRDSVFILDCGFCDSHISDGTFTFGIVREIYIRDCYFKFHPPQVYESVETVVDLGANRGAFTVLMAACAKFVVSVEAQRQFVPVIQHNVDVNGFENVALVRGFVGEGGGLKNCDALTITMEEIFARYELKQVDLLKMDIEGSEFALFESGSWLRRVKALSMEIHPDCGNPQLILSALRTYDFEFVLANEDVERVSDVACAAFVYAWKRSRPFVEVAKSAQIYKN